MQPLPLFSQVAGGVFVAAKLLVCCASMSLGCGVPAKGARRAFGSCERRAISSSSREHNSLLYTSANMSRGTCKYHCYTLMPGYVR